MVSSFQGRVRKGDFNFILEKIDGRLANWKGKLLHKARRNTFAKSVINAIFIYQVQNYWLPQSTCNGIDKVVGNFIQKSKDIG